MDELLHQYLNDRAAIKRRIEAIEEDRRMYRRDEQDQLRSELDKRREQFVNAWPYMARIIKLDNRHWHQYGDGWDWAVGDLLSILNVEEDGFNLRITVEHPEKGRLCTTSLEFVKLIRRE